MKKQKKSLIIILLVLILISISSQKIYASNTNLFQKTEYSEEFKKWIELSDEEKENSIIPRMYEIENTESVSKNPLNIACCSSVIYLLVSWIFLLLSHISENSPVCPSMVIS